MNDKLVVIHQPDFIPYIGFFDRLLKADTYVVLDNVQYVRGNRDHWTNRDKIKTQKGEKWITVSVKKEHREIKISEVTLAEESVWRNRCKNLLRENYFRAEYYNEIMPYVEKLFDYQCERLMDFNLNIISMINKLLGIDIEILLASDIEAQGHKDELLIDIMKKIGQTRYLSGLGAKDYCDEELYKKNGIEIIWQNFQHPVYPQQFGEFVPYLSVIDLLFNCGTEGAKRILKGENIYGTQQCTNQ